MSDLWPCADSYKIQIALRWQNHHFPAHNYCKVSNSVTYRGIGLCHDMQGQARLHALLRESGLWKIKISHESGTCVHAPGQG